MRLLVSLSLIVSIAAVACTLDESGGSGGGSGSATNQMPSDCEETASSLGECGGPPSTTCEPGDSWHWACCYKDHGEWKTTFWECFNEQDGGIDGGIYPDAYIPPDGP